MPRNDFRFVDHVATADAAFEAYGDDLPSLFAVAARALFSVIVDLNQIDPKISREVSLSSETEESLLFDWLAELVYLKDVNRELYREFEVRISTEGGYALDARVKGEKIDPARHQTHTDVKAVTYHQLKITQTDNQFKAFVILDL